MHDDATLPELEEYQRIAPIGQGGQGRVWRAKHRVSGREVALKVATGEEAPRLGVEAQLLASLRHPHVIDVLDWGHEQDVVWAVFELGKSGLRERGPAAPGIAERVLLEILDALAHVHARGILHLDVKPDNVVLGCRRRDDEPLIDDFDGLRLLDFGISVDRARAFQWASSPGFAAPEIQSGTWSRVGAWTDLYSVGRLAAWLVTGTTELPDDWTTPFARWVRRLLADDWRERPAMASDAASDLVPILSVPNAVAPILHASTTRHVVRRVASDRPRPRAPRVLAEPVPDVPVELPERRRWPRGWIGRPRAEHLVARHEEVRGRDREQRQLWARFACVVARGGTEIWNLEGPSGVGKATLRDWFAQRAAELGVAHRVDVTRSLREALVRNFGDLRAWSTASTTTEAVRAGWQGQRPWVVTGALSAEDAAALRTRGPATIVLGDRALPEPDLALVLGPIEPDAMEQLLTDRASLHPRATSQLVLSSGGVPGAALATLHDWLRGPRWSTDGGQHEPMWQDLPPPVLPERSTDPVLAALHDRVASFSEAHPAVDPSEIDDLRMLGPTHLGRTVSVWARRWLAWPALASDERARLELLAARHGRLRPPLIAVAERYTRHADLRIRFEALSCLMASSSAMNDVETTRAALDEMRTLAPEVSLTARLVVAYGEIMYPSDGSVDRSLEQAAWIADVTPTTLGEGWWHCLACERLAEAARFLGRWDDALRWIDLARSDEQRELVPGTLGTGMAYGLVLRGMGRLEEAARVLEELGQRQLATANGGAGDTLECLADVERQLGRLESAETHLLQSIECRHGTELVSTADTAMALLRLDQGREHEVRAILPRLRSYLDKPLTGATVRLMSALVQIRSGDEHAALTEVEAVDHSIVDRNLGRLARQVASEAVTEELRTAAQAVLRRQLDRHPPGSL